MLEEECRTIDCTGRLNSRVLWSYSRSGSAVSRKYRGTPGKLFRESIFVAVDGNVIVSRDDALLLL